MRKLVRPPLATRHYRQTGWIGTLEVNRHICLKGIINKYIKRSRSYRNFDTFFFLKSFYTFTSNFEIEAKQNASYGLVLKIKIKRLEIKRHSF